MWCKACRYVLDGLDRNRCPECGRPFDPAIIASFSLEPTRDRLWWLKVAALSAIALLAGAGIQVLSRTYKVDLDHTFLAFASTAAVATTIAIASIVMLFRLRIAHLLLSAIMLFIFMFFSFLAYGLIGLDGVSDLIWPGGKEARAVMQAWRMLYLCWSATAFAVLTIYLMASERWMRTRVYGTLAIGLACALLRGLAEFPYSRKPPWTRLYNWPEAASVTLLALVVVLLAVQISEALRRRRLRTRLVAASNA
jgi:hypothetical protein